MDFYCIFLLMLVINLGCVVSELSLRFVFIIEVHEQDLPPLVGRALKIAEDSQPETRVDDAIVLLDRQNEEESYRQLCSSVSSGVSTIIDLSWSPWDSADQLASDAGVPLVRTLLGSQQLMRALDEYLESRNATDAALLLESEGDVDRTLYELLGESNVRVWVHAGLTRDSARALKSMRPEAPEPSFYAIIGGVVVALLNHIHDDTLDGVHTTFTIPKCLNTYLDVDRTLYELLGESNVRVWVHAGLTRDSARALKSMRPEPSFYGIIGGGTFVADTYKRAVKEKLVRHDYRWNLVLTGYSPLDVSPVVPAMTLHVDPAECCRILGRKDGCSCSQDFERKLPILSALIQLLVETYSKLEDESAFTARVDCDNLVPELNETRARLYRQLAEDSGASNESVFYWDGNRYGLFLRSRFILSTLKPDAGLETAASWTADEEYKLLPGVTLEPLRQFFRIGTAPAVPWTMPKLDPVTGEPMFNDDGQPIYEGYCIDLIHKLSESMDFDYEIVTPKAGTFGRRLPNGTWDGVVGDLMRAETDMAVSALTMTAEREEVIDFVAPYFEQSGILIVIRKPTRKTSLFKFMTVLRTEVWLSIVAALVLTGFMIWLLDKYSPYSAANSPHAYPYPCREFTLKESFWFALTSFTPQGGGEAPKALSGRTLVAAYWLFVVLMLATFTANLAAFLTVERMQTPVSSLEQLARQSRINYTVVEGSTIHQYFINMKFAEDTLYRVWKEITLNATSDQSQYRVWDYPIREQYGHILLAINASIPVPDAKTGFRQVDEHTDADFAFIHDSAEIKYEVTLNCNLTEVGDVFAEQPYAIAVQQGSRLQEELSRALLDLQKERLLEQLAAKYWNETARQQCPDADESEGITLESLGGVFIATLFGLGLAMITLAWEVFYYKRKEKNKVQILEDTEKKPKKAFVKDSDKKISDSVARLRKGRKKGRVTIGDTFKPVSEKEGVSYISVYPKTEYKP